MPSRIPASWRAFGRFLLWPALPSRASGLDSSGLAAVARLYPLDLLLMFVLIGTAGALTWFGFEFPAHRLEEIEIGPALVAFILIGAPIGEEILFRSWLSGRPGHVLAFLCALAGLALAYLATQALPAPASGIAALAALAAGIAGAVLALWRGRDKPAWEWFQRRFAWFYYASALAFASVHLVNFGAASPALLPLTLPQLILGLILGYLRVHHGLWSAIAFHAAHNTLFIGIVLFASGAG